MHRHDLNLGGRLLMPSFPPSPPVILHPLTTTARQVSEAEARAFLEEAETAPAASASGPAVPAAAEEAEDDMTFD